MRAEAALGSTAKGVSASRASSVDNAAATRLCLDRHSDQPITTGMVENTHDNAHEVTTFGGYPDRDAWLAVRRGWRERCPSCGEGALYWKYLKVNDTCPACGTELHHHRADDAPPYFVMTITAHVVVGGILVLEKLYAPPTWVQLAIWTPVLILLSLWLLPRIKGALIGYQWALKMHGFGNTAFGDPELGGEPNSGR
jgi:uncharacterized protein (DUF983 family)